MDSIERSVGHVFSDRSLLLQALTHPSYGGDHHVPHYQRLEFLGDAVLELLVSERLYAARPNAPEGVLTRMRARLVCEESLSAAANRLGFPEHILLSVGEERSGGRKKPSIAADVFEAVLGAVYLDGGKEAAEKMLEITIGTAITEEAERSDGLDVKSRLQAYTQQRGEMPVYTLTYEGGPAHKPIFKYDVSAFSKVLGSGEGQSKQAAQTEAAKDALSRLGLK